MIKQWGFYLANIPFWDNGSLSFKHKTRPVLIYNIVGGDVIALPVTSNENNDGSEKENNKPWLVKIKLERYSLIKANKPLTISKDALFKYFRIQATNKARRQVRESFNNWVVLREIKR